MVASMPPTHAPGNVFTHSLKAVRVAGTGPSRSMSPAALFTQ
jgi:hypothetical protein